MTAKILVGIFLWWLIDEHGAEKALPAIGFMWVLFKLIVLFEQNEDMKYSKYREIEDSKNSVLNEIREKEETIRHNQDLAELAEKERKEREYEEWKIENPNLGFVYVLKNEMAKGHVKIGFTNGKTAKRIKEINSGTGVIGKWQLVKHWHVNDARDCEQRIHRKFRYERTQKNREFFEIDEEKVVFIIQEMMEKRGYYVDRKYWKDGECRTIYSDNETLSQSDLEQLKANLILAPENTKGRGVFGVDRRFDLCSYYNKSAAELMEHLEIKYYCIFWLNLNTHSAPI